MQACLCELRLGLRPVLSFFSVLFIYLYFNAVSLVNEHFRIQSDFSTCT